MPATLIPLAQRRYTGDTPWAEAIAAARALPHAPHHLLYWDGDTLAWLPHRPPCLNDRWLRVRCTPLPAAGNALAA